MKAVVVSQRIPISAQTAWNIVRTGDRLNRWMPVVTSCRLEGSGVGARRVCTINGQDLGESLETVDDANRLFQYRIHEQNLMPVRDALGTIHLTAIGPTETEVLWMMNFEMTDEKAWPAVQESMAGLYQAGITGLGAFALGSGAA